MEVVLIVLVMMLHVHLQLLMQLNQILEHVNNSVNVLMQIMILQPAHLNQVHVYGKHQELQHHVLLMHVIQSQVEQIVNQYQALMDNHIQYVI
jgi:hypothetical protein